MPAAARKVPAYLTFGFEEARRRMKPRMLRGC
jgi:hypothetical protein